MTLKRGLEAVMLVTALNFVAFVVVALIIGGDAINGHSESGRYYLANHGILTEVSEPTFIYSMTHAISVIVLFGLALICEIALRIIAWREHAAFDQSTDAMLREMRARSNDPT
jgi:hypothetical protein